MLKNLPVTRSNTNPTAWLLVLVILGMALCIGLLVGVSDPVGITVLFSAVLVLIAGALWPLYAILIALALVFEAIPIGAVATVGSVKPHEVLVAYLAGVVFVRAIFARQSLLGALAEFKWPLIYLACCITASLIYATFFARNPYVLGELRGFTVWLTLPMLALSIKDERDRVTFTRGLFFIAIVMATIVIIQSFFNVKILTEARVEVLDAEGNSDVTRSIAGGATYLIVFMLYYTILMPDERRWSMTWRVLGALLMILGLAVTFGRGVWIATTLGLMLSTFIARGIRGVVSTAAIGAAMVVVVLALAAMYNPRISEAVIERASGVGQEIQSGGSYAWRGLENRAAYAALRDRPWTGVGIGGEYKKTISSQGHFEFETLYIHNAYVGYAVKMGLPGALFPPLMILCFIVTARRIFKRVTPDGRLIVSSLVGAFLVPCITSYTQPEWLNDQGIAAFSMLITLLLLVGRQMVDPNAVHSRKRTGLPGGPREPVLEPTLVAPRGLPHRPGSMRV